MGGSYKIRLTALLAVVVAACAVQEDEPQVASVSQRLGTTFDSALCGNTAGLQKNAAWPAFGACPTGRRSTPEAATTSNIINWTFPTGLAIQSSPAIGADETVYVGSNDGRLYAIAPDGVQKWSTSLVGGVRSSPAIGADGTIYVGSDLTGVYALNPADGSTKWNFFTIGTVRSSPVVGGDGTIYVATSGTITQLGNALFALTPSGTQKFRVPMNSASSSAPAIAPDGTIYVASDGVPVVAPKTLYAVNPTTGALKWSAAVNGSTTSGPAVAPDGTIYIGGQRTLRAFNPDGTSKWTFAISCSTFGDCNISGTPAIGPSGAIFTGTNDGRLLGISTAGTGFLDKSFGNRIEASVAVDSTSTVFLSVTNNRLLEAVSGNNGAVLFSVTTGGAIHSSAAISGRGTVYVGSDDGKLYSIGERSTGFVRGTPPIPIGECNNNRVPKGTTTSVCLTTPDPAANRVDMYVNGKLTPSSNNCVSVTVNGTVEIRSFEYLGLLRGSHVTFLTTDDQTKHCPIYDKVLLGGPGDDVLIGTSDSEYISGGPGIDYIVPRGGNDIILGGDDPDTIDLTGPTDPAGLAGLKILEPDLFSDVVLVNFPTSSLPQATFSPSQSCTQQGCVSVQPKFEKTYVTELARAGYDQASIRAVRQVHDIGGGYVIAGTRTNSTSVTHPTDAFISKLSPNGEVKWTLSGAKDVRLQDSQLLDVQEYYDDQDKRRGFVAVGSGDFPSPSHGIIVRADLDGTERTFQDFSGFLTGDTSGGFSVRNGFNAIRVQKNFVVVAGYTDSNGSSLFPSGPRAQNAPEQGLLVVFLNISASSPFQFLADAGFAPDASVSGLRTGSFFTAEVVPPAPASGQWSVVLGGTSNPGVFGAPVGPEGFVVRAQLGTRLTGPLGTDRDIHAQVIREIPSNAGLLTIGGVAITPEGRAMLGGATDAFRQPQVPALPSPTGFLKLVDTSLGDVWSAADPEAGPFFTASPGFRMLGGYTRSQVQKVIRLTNGSYVALGSMHHPWTDALLTNAVLEELIDGATLVDHALLVRTDPDGLGRRYQTFGHDAQSGAHLLNSMFFSGEETADLGLVAAGQVCLPGKLPCSPRPYLVKLASDGSTAGITCSCSDQLVTCGESPTGFRTLESTARGDCGGSSTCGACAVDCGNGVKDGDEEDVDCGGRCSDPKFTPNGQPHPCPKCKEGQCGDNDPCTQDICDPAVGCQHPPVSCPSGSACSGGTCVNNCTNCDDGKECTDDSCIDPVSGCRHQNRDGQSCNNGAGQCVGSECTATCTAASCNDGEECTTDSCATGSCVHSNLGEGTPCAGGFCRSGRCVVTFYDDVAPILKQKCAPCHTGAGTSCPTGVCFANCYEVATQFTNCGINISPDPYPAQPMYSCIAARVSDGSMPFNSQCGTPNATSKCPTQSEIDLINAWSANGHEKGTVPSNACQ